MMLLRQELGGIGREAEGEVLAGVVGKLAGLEGNFREIGIVKEGKSRERVENAKDLQEVTTRIKRKGPEVTGSHIKQ